MAWRKFRFHAGGGNLQYDSDPAAGVTYGADTSDTSKDVSNTIARLIRRGEWCHRCDLELPEPISSATIEASVLRAVRGGQMNLGGMPWSVVAGRLADTRCPSCGALMTPKMIEQQMRS